MKTAVILILIALINVSYGFYAELDYDISDDTADLQGTPEDYMNVVEHVDDRERYGCRQARGEEEDGEMKLIVRLKRMVECRG